MGLDGIGGIVGQIAVEFWHRTHKICQFVNNGRGTLLLKNTATYDTESVDELLSVFVVLEQIQEQADHCNPLKVVEYLSQIAWPFATIKCIIEVEEDKAIATVVLTAIGLDIVVWPVIVAKKQLYSHIVGKLVDIEQRFHLIIDAWVINAGGKFAELLKDIFCTILELFVLKHINFIVVITEIGIDKLVVVGLP